MTRSPLLVMLLTGMILVALLIGQQRSANNVLAYSAPSNGNHRVTLLDADSGIELVYGYGPQEGGHFCPIWSPDGRKLAFDRFTNTGVDIVVRNIESGDITNLTRTLSGYKDALRWSPNSEYIAFHQENDLYIGEASTGNLIRVTETKSISTMPLWSPDSSMLAYNEDGEIYLYTLDSQETKQIMDRGVRLDFLEPLYFFDNTSLMVGIHGERRRTYVILDTNTGSYVPLIPGAGEMLGEFKWSPDGDTIAYIDFRGRETLAFTWHWSDPTPLVLTDQRQGVLSWSPDQKSAYTTYHYDAQKYLVQILGISPARGGEQTLAEFHIDAEPHGPLQDVAWSPSGEYIIIEIQTSVDPTVTILLDLQSDKNYQFPKNYAIGCSGDPRPQWRP